MTEDDVATRISVDRETKCAHWTGSFNKKSPVLYKNGMRYWVRSWVYQLRKGAVDRGYYVHMACNNRDCVNSNHMELRPRGRRFARKTDKNTG